MILTGVTDSMLEKAIREESLLQNHDPPKEAVREMAIILHETECSHWDEHMDEQAAWDRMPIGAKQMHLGEAAWAIGRLAFAGFSVSRYNVVRVIRQKP